MYEEHEIEEFAPWLAIVIVLIGGGLRVLLLGTKGMAWDETFSVWVADHSIVEMLEWIVKIDQHPPLYYWLLHYWIELRGNTPYDARLLSALFSAGTIPVIYLIGKRMSGVAVGLAAAVFLALSPLNIFYAQEARMYTLLAFNAALAIYALVRLLTDARSVHPIGSQFRQYLQTWRSFGAIETDSEEGFHYEVELPRSGLRAWINRHHWANIETIETDLAWVGFILFSVATLLSHNTAVFFPVATNIFVLGLMLIQRVSISGTQPAIQAPSLVNWFKAQIGIFILWSPWTVAFFKQAGRVYQEFWIPKPTRDTILQTLRSLLNASEADQASQMIVIWILCIVLGLGLIYYRKKLSLFFFLATLFAVPFLGELIVSIRRPIFWDHTLIWITVPLFLLLAAGIAQLRYRLLMILVLGFIAINYFFSASDYFRFFQKEDWSTAAGYVANFVEKDDLVLFNSNFGIIPFDYYFEPYERQYSIQVEKHGIPQDLFESGILEPKMTADDIPGLLSLLSGYNRVWLVYSRNSYTDPDVLIPQTLASQMDLVRKRDFLGGQVQLYGNP